MRFAIATDTGGGIITIGGGDTAIIGGTGVSGFTGATTITTIIDSDERCGWENSPAAARALQITRKLLCQENIPSFSSRQH